ncbi:MAG TPA: protein phosphatase 2C domain-containing protein [Candidatus Acidoferrales bacterium]|nr:protein phosphatase 2C domain-containing protein [Candidatus Acidoferrales bacterium]
MRLKLAWATDAGLERAKNEDAVLVRRGACGIEALLVVCDGMGGHAAGDTASRLAIDAFDSFLADGSAQGPSLDSLRAASDDANRVVYAASKSNPAWAGMGTTLVGMVLDRDQAAVVNVGDSPAWLYRDGGATLISEDHSWPAEQVRQGILRPEEAEHHPMKHRLTRALGVWDTIATFTNLFEVRAGDLLVVCSDGIESAGLGAKEMGSLLAGDLEEGVKRVIQHCLRLGAPDNLTLAAAVVESVDGRPEGTGTLVMRTAAADPTDASSAATVPG